MLEVRVISGCRKTYRSFQNLPQVEIPIYLEETMASIHSSDIPTDRVSVYIDSLGSGCLEESEEKTLTIEKAYYGTPDQKLGVDLTEQVRQKVRCGSVFLFANNHFAGGDPAQYEKKVLLVDYTLDGASASIALQEGDSTFIGLQKHQLDPEYVATVRRLATRYKIPFFVSRGGGLNIHLPEILQHPSREDFVLLLEDDVRVDRQIYQKTTEWIEKEVPDLIFGSLYNVFGGRTQIDAGGFFMGQAMILRSSKVPAFLSFLRNYEQMPGAEPGWMDIKLSRIAGRGLHAPIYLPRHSLVEHIGGVSKWR